MLRPEPPTPRKMMLESSSSPPIIRERRRNSGIPRPTSGTSRRVISSSQKLVSADIPATSLPPSSYNTSHPQPPPSDILSSSNHVYESRDLSGVRQQLNIRNFSTKLVQDLDALSPRRNAPVRHLMRPIGPPLPRSQTIGIIPNGGGHALPKQEEYPNPSRFDKTTKIDVADALHESRMTLEEMALLNRVHKEKEKNQKQLRNRGTAGAIPPMSAHVSQATKDLESNSSRFMTRATETQDQNRTRKAAHTVCDNGLRVNTAIENAARSPPSSLSTHKARLSIRSVPSDSCEIHPRYVYFSQPTTYWTGRYMALIDQSKTKDVDRTVSTSCLEDPKNKPESYELLENQRIQSVLDDLRSCCKTEKALQSLRDFEEALPLSTAAGKSATSYERLAIPSSTVTCLNEMQKDLSKSKHPCLFGSTSGASTTSNSIKNLSKAISNNKIPIVANRKGGLTKSLTTGNLTLSESGMKKADLSSSAVLRGDKSVHARQISNLSFQAQVNAKLLREREARAIRRVEETKRRVSSRSLIRPISPGNEDHEKRKIAPQDRVTIATSISRREKPLPRIPRFQDSIPPVEPSPEKTTIAISTPVSSKRQLFNSSENRNTSIASSGSRIFSQEETPSRGRHGSEPRVLARRTNRQSSGEILKNMVTGGLKGVRRMRRSLAGKTELDEVGTGHFSKRASEAGTQVG